MTTFDTSMEAGSRASRFRPIAVCMGQFVQLIEKSEADLRAIIEEAAKGRSSRGFRGPARSVTFMQSFID